jgi:YidC/Oxa1 family membrane protein insertase
MFSQLWHTLVYDPIYNALILLLQAVPNADIGVAIILLTLLIKFVLFPLSIKAVKTQYAMRQIQPELERIKEQYKDDRQEQSRQMMELWRKHDIKPFSSLFTTLIQIPIVIALYWIFAFGGLPEVSTDLLYGFVPTPVPNPHMELFGIIGLAGKSLPLALLVGISMFVQIRLSMPAPKPPSDNPSMKEDFTRSMQLQMRYVMPVLIAVVSYWVGAAAALYLLVSNLFAIGQELYMRHQIRPRLDTQYGAVATEEQTDATQDDGGETKQEKTAQTQQETSPARSS